MSLLYATAPNEVQEEDAEALQRALQPAALPSTATAATDAAMAGSVLHAPGPAGQGVAQRLSAVAQHNAQVAQALLQWEQMAQEVRESSALHDGELAGK